MGRAPAVGGSQMAGTGQRTLAWARWPLVEACEVKKSESIIGALWLHQGKCSMLRTPSDRRLRFGNKEEYIYLFTLPLAPKCMIFFSVSLLPCKYICFEGKLFIWLIV